MEEPLSFVRDNPFVKNDGCRRLLRRNPVLGKDRTQEASSFPEQLGYTIKKVMVVDKEADDQQDNISTGSSSDIEYGPGIVEKLKAKFHQLSGIASREAKVSPHATGKRCPSMDDILSAESQPLPTWENQPDAGNTLHKTHSKSMGDVFDEMPEKRNYQIHRAAKIGDEDYDDPTDVQSISVLRQKFEQNVQRRPSQNRRDSKFYLTNNERAPRPKSVDFSDHELVIKNIPTKSFTVLQSIESCSCQIPVSCCQQTESVDCYRARGPASPVVPLPVEIPCIAPVAFDDRKPRITRKEPVSQLRVLEVLNQPQVDDEVPEFVKIGRRLKRSPLHLDDMPEKIELKKEIAEDVSFISPRPDSSIDHAVVYRSYDPSDRVSTWQREESSRQQEPRKYIVRGKPDIPVLTNNTKIIRETENSRAFEIYSPPDPDPGRFSFNESHVVIPSTSDVRIVADSSPPPEEPKPRMTVESPSYKKPVSSVPSEDSSDNRATVQEMLNRFQKNRDNRMIDFGGHNRDEFEEERFETRKAFVPALVGVRSCDESRANLTSPISYASPSNKCNVISISVSPDNDDISLCSTSTSSSLVRRSSDEEENIISPVTVNTVTKKPAPTAPVEAPPAVPSTPPPSVPHYATSPILNTSSIYTSVEASPLPSTDRPNSLSSQENLIKNVARKSLSSLYLEEKFKHFLSVSNDKPYGDDATELKSGLKEPSVDEDVLLNKVSTTSISLPEVESQLANLSQDSEGGFSSDSDSDDPPLHSRIYNLSFNEPLRAGDGNPVRQSLLSIVMEEDVPFILEAMSEKYDFEFEDLDTTPSTSSIIHPVEKRQQRRKERKVSGIRFEQKTPIVYTYLDENSAISSREWLYGTEMNYYDYQRLFDPEFEEYERNVLATSLPTPPATSSSLVESFLEGCIDDYSLNADLNQNTNKENPTM